MSLSTAFSPKALRMIPGSSPSTGLEAPALFEEQALEQIGRAGRAAVGDRQAQVRDAGLEVVGEAGHGRGQLGLLKHRAFSREHILRP